MKLVLNIKANVGYAPEQVSENHNLTTVGELKDWLEGYDDDTEIVTNDQNNKYGANYGSILSCYKDYSDEEEQ